MSNLPALLRNVTAENYPAIIRNITAELTIQKSIENGCKLRVLKQNLGFNQSLAIVSLALDGISKYLNLNNQFKLEQAVEVAELLLEEFPEETIEDVLLFAKNMKLCKYGTNYNRLDGQIIFQCFRMFLNEKYEILEKQLQNAKETHKINAIGVGVTQEQKQLNEIYLQKISDDMRHLIAKKNKQTNSTQHKPTLKEMAESIRGRKQKK